MSGVELFEKRRIEAAISKRAARKQRQQERLNGLEQQPVTLNHPIQTQQDQERTVSSPDQSVANDDKPFKCAFCANLGYIEEFKSSKGLSIHTSKSNRHKTSRQQP